MNLLHENVTDLRENETVGETPFPYPPFSKMAAILVFFCLLANQPLLLRLNTSY